MVAQYLLRSQGLYNLAGAKAALAVCISCVQITHVFRTKDIAIDYVPDAEHIEALLLYCGECFG